MQTTTHNQSVAMLAQVLYQCAKLPSHECAMTSLTEQTQAVCTAMITPPQVALGVPGNVAADVSLMIDAMPRELYENGPMSFGANCADRELPELLKKRLVGFYAPVAGGFQKLGDSEIAVLHDVEHDRWTWGVAFSPPILANYNVNASGDGRPPIGGWVVVDPNMLIAGEMAVFATDALHFTYAVPWLLIQNKALRAFHPSEVTAAETVESGAPVAPIEHDAVVITTTVLDKAHVAADILSIMVCSTKS